MNREEQIKTLTDDINIYLDFDGTCECVKEDGECHPNYQVTIETPTLAKRLVNRGWNKIVWHKVADGNLPKPCQNIWFIDKITNLGFSGYYNDIDKVFISDFDNNFCIKKRRSNCLDGITKVWGGVIIYE